MKNTLPIMDQRRYESLQSGVELLEQSAEEILLEESRMKRTNMLTGGINLGYNVLAGLLIYSGDLKQSQNLVMDYVLVRHLQARANAAWEKVYTSANNISEPDTRNPRGAAA
jgi:hypothetical protein